MSRQKLMEETQVTCSSSGQIDRLRVMLVDLTSGPKMRFKTDLIPYTIKRYRI